MNFSYFKEVLRKPRFIQYFYNTNWLFLEKALRIISVLFVEIWIAKFLGPADYGLLSYAISYAGLFLIIAPLGSETIIVRDLVKGIVQPNDILTTSIILRLLGAIATLILLYIFVNYIFVNTEAKVLIYIISILVLFQVTNVIDSYFQSKVQSKFVVYAKMISLSITSLVRIMLIIYDASLTSFAIAILVEGIILSMLLVFFYSKKGLRIDSWKINKNYASSLLKDGLPLLLSGFVVLVYMRIDQIMIDFMINNVAVGQYAAAVRLSEAWYFLPLVISSSLFPAIINAKKNNLQEYKDRMRKLYSFLILVAYIVVIPVTLMSELIIDFLYGVAYAEASSVLVIHVWTSLFVFLAISSGKYMIAEGMTKKILYRHITGMIINIIGNIILIPYLGIKGAAVSTLIAWLVSGYLYDFFDKDLRETFYDKTKALLLLGYIGLALRKK